MTKIKTVPLTKETNSQLDDIVERRQIGSFNMVTKKGVVGELVDKAHKREVKK